MSRKTWIFGLIAILAIVAFISVLNQNRVQPVQDTKNPPSANQSEIENLPETSAIKQAIIKAKIQEERERMEEKEREAIAKRRAAAEEIGKKYGVRYLEDGFYEFYRYFNSNFNDQEGYGYLPIGTTKVKNPAYPHCVRDQWSKDDIRYSSECVYETFLLERLSENIPLQDALFAAKTGNVKIILTMNRFHVDTRTLLININADDQTIINYLTKDAKIAESNK